MKLNSIILGVAAAAMLTGCSAVSSVTKSVSNSVTSTVSKINRGKKGVENASRDKDKALNVGNIETLANTPVYAGEVSFKPTGEVPTVSQLCSGQWVIIDVQGTELHGEDDAPYVAFDRTGRFYAYDGCNYLNGFYVLRADGILTLNQVISTLRMCEQEYSYQIDGVLSDGAKLYLDSKRIGQETYLYLKNASGKTQLTLRRHNMEFLNGNWQVTALDGEAVAREDMTVFFDIPELKMHGNTGCNYVNGSIYIDPDRSNALDISNMAVTRMGCPYVKQETAMLVALENTTSAIAGHNFDSVILLDKNGNELMTLKRLSNPE